MSNYYIIPSAISEKNVRSGICPSKYHISTKEEATRLLKNEAIRNSFKKIKVKEIWTNETELKSKRTIWGNKHLYNKKYRTYLNIDGEVLSAFYGVDKISIGQAAGALFNWPDTTHRHVLCIK